MSFSARLLSDLIAVESGATVPLSVELTNKSGEQDRFELQIEGLDPEWIAVPVPFFTVEPNETVSERLFFKPPRASESLAGNYPFVLRVRSLESGDSKALQGVLQIKPYHHLSMEILPKKGHVSPLRKHDSFGLTVMNLGNTEHTLQLFGSDPEDVCAFDFEHEQITIGPGQQKTIEVELNTTGSRVLAGSRLHGFSISGRSIETPSVMASAQAQLEERPLLSFGGLLAMLIFAIVAGFWAYLIPKPPTITVSLDRHESVAGQPVTIRWNATSANNAWIIADNKMLIDAGSPQGTISFTPMRAGTVEIEAYSAREGKQSEHHRVDLLVTEPPVVPEPKIVSFKGPTTVKTGQPFLLTYQFNEGVTDAYIAPNQVKVDLNVNEIQLLSTEPGSFTYTLVAKNSAGKVTKKSVKVDVEDVCKAVIVSFTPSENPVDPLIGRVTLNWQLSDAKSANISDGVQVKVLDATTTSMEFVLTKTTTYTLTAYDDRGKWIKKSLTVKFGELPVPQAPPGDAAGAGGAGAGGGGQR